MPILGCKMPILELIKLASHRAKRKAKWCKTHPNTQIWTEQNGHKSTIQPLNVWFKTAIRARMERRKRVFCKIYLPKLGYPKNLPTNFPLPPTAYYLLPHYLLPHYLLPHYLLPYYLLPHYLLPHYLLPHYLLPYYLLPYYLLPYYSTTYYSTTYYSTTYYSTTYYSTTYYSTTYYSTTYYSTTYYSTTNHPTTFINRTE